MTLVKRNYNFRDPFSELGRFFDQSLWDTDFFGRSRAMEFPVDLYGDDDSYYLVAELPGFSKKDIDIKLENTVLTIEAKHESKDESERLNQWSRAMSVPSDIDAEKVGAKLENGILYVTLPKAEEKKSKVIRIK